MSGSKPKFAFVVQRFGENVVGGAEAHCMSLVNKLKREFDVHVYTSTSLYYEKWDDSLPSGVSLEAGITAHRFSPRCRRFKFLGIASRILFPLLKRIPKCALSRKLESFWVRLQGPYCPNLVAALKASRAEYQAIYLMTYLYYPSLEVCRQVPGCIYIPTAHDEIPFGFSIVGQALRQCKKIFANTEHEKKLILKTHKISAENIKVVGVGVDYRDALVRHSQDSKQLLYLGRISKGKGVDKLLTMFFELADRQDYTLNLVGGISDDSLYPLMERPNVKYYGYVEEERKWELIHNADLIICPSPHESLSLLTLEGILAKKPVLLTSACPLFCEYATKYPSVFTYGDTSDFQALVKSLTTADWIPKHAKELSLSKTLVEERYGWNNVLSYFSSEKPT